MNVLKLNTAASMSYIAIIVHVSQQVRSVAKQEVTIHLLLEKNNNMLQMAVSHWKEIETYTADEVHERYCALHSPITVCHGKELSCPVV